MEKLDKVIAGLECCIACICSNCEYFDPSNEAACTERLMMDALAVIKALRTERDDLRKDIAVLTEWHEPMVMDGDLIPRAAVLKFPIRQDHCDKENGNPHFIYGIETVMEYVEYIPAVEAEPVVHAHWIRVGWGYCKCSHCEAEVGVVSGHKNYCANCGARMDEEVTDGE